MSIHTPDPLQTKTMEIITVDVGLPAGDRCDRCGAQAYVEVELPSASRLLFCVHHYVEHEDALVLSAGKIIDHRPFLAKQEAAFKGATTP